METIGAILAFIIIGGPLLGLYLIPSFIAQARQHPQGPSIFLLNVIAGWTILGWIAALGWALAAPPAE